MELLMITSLESQVDIKTNFHSIGKNNIVNVVIVGCGGGGSRLAPLMAQHIANHNKAVAMNMPHLKIKSPMALTLIDKSGDDVLEERNLRRQNFYQFDVGLPKAEALAKRLGALYGITITYRNEPFSTYALDRRNIIVFDCTDNKEARQSIEKICVDSYFQNILLISCGNEDTYGQIYLSYRNVRPSTRQNMAKTFYEVMRDNLSEELILPTFVQSNPDYKDSPARSCDQIVLVDDQSMPVNNLVITLAFNAFYTIMAEDKFNYFRANCNIYNQYYTQYLTKTNIINLLIPYLVGNRDNGLEVCKNLVDTYLEKYGNTSSYYKWSYFDEFNQYYLRNLDANISN
jgi:molybdopterin/thiamine biosynthesis adenylyltransferase